jgi:hypothetical protein
MVISLPDEDDIDRLYGLEPVIRVGEEAGSDALSTFVDRLCPYCGEPIQLHVDVSAGSQAYIEDCQVCCQPFQVCVIVEEGELQEVAITPG